MGNLQTKQIQAKKGNKLPYKTKKNKGKIQMYNKQNKNITQR